jgi:peptidoglycan hydrolase-like protein with peptidoglycan-binding domain
MSVDAFSGLPFQAGQAVASSIGRTARWAIAAYMRAPLRNTAVAALTTLCAMAGSNALYNQSGNHPAPLFGSFEGRTQPVEPTPVMPLERPVKLLLEPAPETTGSVSAAVPEPTPVKPIGNEDVFEIQRKLTAFKLFDGKVDGLYGPRTARSIRAFEESVGRPATGQLTQEIIELIKATPITADPGLKLEAAAVSQPAPVTAEIKPEETAVLSLEDTASLPAPAPLTASSEAAAVQPAPEPVLDSAVAEEGVSTLEMTSPPAEQPAPAAASNGPTKRSVQTIAITAPAPEPVAATEVITTPIDVTKVANDPKVIGAIQRGLASLGFLHGEIDGVAGEATAKAIRNFEVYYNYNVTGRITPELVNLLVQNGAVI